MPDTTAIDQKPREFAAGEFAIPSKADLAKARKARDRAREAKDSTPFGTVVGLDAEKYAPALIDLALPPERQAYYRKRFADKGYARVQGKPLVVGYDRGCEVWVKSIEDRRAALDDRRDKIERAVVAGRMHPSALGARVQTKRMPQPRSA